MICARAMGACIMMRDDPADTPIPDRFDPSDYHINALAEANAEMSRLEKMTEDEIAFEAAAANARAVESWEEAERKTTETRARYEAMLTKVRNWTPPTSEHENFKNFMVEQLTKSIDWDCQSRERPEPLTPLAWISSRIERAEWDVNYHTEQHQKEIDRAAGRTKWIVDLRESLRVPA